MHLNIVNIQMHSQRHIFNAIKASLGLYKRQFHLLFGLDLTLLNLAIIRSVRNWEKTSVLLLSLDDELLLHFCTPPAFDWCSTSSSDQFSFRYFSWHSMLYFRCSIGKIWLRQHLQVFVLAKVEYQNDWIYRCRKLIMQRNGKCFPLLVRLSFMENFTSLVFYRGQRNAAICKCHLTQISYYHGNGTGLFS